jgi:subtilisin family serine protease
MKKILVLSFLIFSIIGFAQQNSHFYVEFSDLILAPSVNSKKDGTLSLTSNDNQIDDIYKKYIIYKFERIAPNAISENLQKTYLVECNNIQLMNDLRINFPSIYVIVENIEKPIDGGILYTPNDYTLLEQSLGSIYEQSYLNAINAKGAWDITHGSPNVKIGIADTGFHLSHEELINKNAVIVGTNNDNYPSNFHGTDVTGLAAGDTNNNKGISSIGFNSGVVVKVGTGYVPNFTGLVDNGAKVVNGSWYTTITENGGTPSLTDQNLINDYTNQNVVVVVAAGNGPGSGWAPSVVNAENYSKRYYYPASYKNVISVSTVGNKNIPNSTITPFDNWLNVHKIKTPPNSYYSGTSTLISETEIFNQHNDSVDIVVPSYRLPLIGAWSNNEYWAFEENGTFAGTSFSAPIVSGTVGLMFAVNYCLKPKEVESILKLTATNIEDIPENLPYKGKLGGGSLNAFRAVEMANEMAKPFGTVNVIDRILYRNWFYKLETAPFEIKMSNNNISNGAKIKFFAKDNIEILSGDYKPDIGYVDLQINTSLSLNCSIPSSNKFNNEGSFKTKIQNSTEVKLYPNPNTGVFTVSVSQKDVKDLNIELFDIFGKSVFKTISNNANTEIDIQNIANGVYLVKLTSPKINEVLKLIKK